MLNIIGNRFKFITISIILVVVSFVLIISFGFKLGIDFTGGSLWQIKFENQNISDVDIKNFLNNNQKLESYVYKELSSDSVIIKLAVVSEESHQQYLGLLKNKFGDLTELKFESIGPSVGDQMKSRSIWAIIFVLIGISSFIAISFRKISYPVKSWKYGISTLIALFHDVTVPLGVIVAMGHWGNVEMDANFIVALLVIMGFSVHDTIVVFDRIRENLLSRKISNFDQVVNESVNQTMARSINTSLTLVLVLLALVFFGPTTLKDFNVILLIGVVAGTYSSIFIASPILTIWHKSSNVK